MMLKLWEEMDWLLFMKIVLPRISCLLLISDHAFVQNFWEQIYPNKELVIVTRDGFSVEGAICKKAGNIDDNWLKDLAIELSTGDMICWWEKLHHPFYLSKRIAENIQDESFFSKDKFYKEQNMLYSKSKLENEAYYEV